MVDGLEVPSERYLITLDADNPGEDFIVDLDMELGGMEYVLYSTHSHTADILVTA